MHGLTSVNIIDCSWPYLLHVDYQHLYSAVGPMSTHAKAYLYLWPLTYLSPQSAGEIFISGYKRITIYIWWSIHFMLSYPLPQKMHFSCETVRYYTSIQDKVYQKVERRKEFCSVHSGMGFTYRRIEASKSNYNQSTLLV